MQRAIHNNSLRNRGTFTWLTEPNLFKPKILWPLAALEGISDENMHPPPLLVSRVTQKFTQQIKEKEIPWKKKEARQAHAAERRLLLPHEGEIF